MEIVLWCGCRGADRTCFSLCVAWAVAVIAECVQLWTQLQATSHSSLEACTEALRLAAVDAQDGQQALLVNAQSAAVALGHLQRALWLMAAALPLLEQHDPTTLLPRHLPEYFRLFGAKATALGALGFARVAADVLRLGWCTGQVLRERLALSWPAEAAAAVWQLGNEIPFSLLWARRLEDATEARRQLIVSQCARLSVRFEVVQLYYMFPISQ